MNTYVKEYMYVHIVNIIYDIQCAVSGLYRRDQSYLNQYLYLFVVLKTHLKWFFANIVFGIFVAHVSVSRQSYCRYTRNKDIRCITVIKSPFNISLCHVINKYLIDIFERKKNFNSFFINY